MPPSRVLAEAPERLGLRVTMLQLAVYADLAPRLTRLGLSSPSRMTALLHIRAHPGCSQSELAEYTGLSRASAATMVGQLETAGLVTRESGANARTNALFLTATGETVIERSHEQTAINEALIFGALSRAERETLLRLLEKVILDVERKRTGEQPPHL
jgi:DNA-binding MarR family transcriptional regulator